MSNSRFARALFCAAAVASLCGSPAQAIDGYWYGQVSNVWNEGVVEDQSNWYSGPGGTGNLRTVPDHTATFGGGALTTSLIINVHSSVGHIVFERNAARYSFDFVDRLYVGIGITNRSNRTPRFRIRDQAGLGLEGTAAITGTGAPAVEVTTEAGGALAFHDSARGGNATVINNGYTTFFHDSSAEQMTITNRPRGQLAFLHRSTGDQAHIVNRATGVFTCENRPPRLRIASLDNKGTADVRACTLDVAGAFAQSETGVLRVFVSPNKFGTVVSGQDAQVGGTVIVHIEPAVPVPQTFMIVRTSGRRTGSFASVRIVGRNDVRARLAYSARAVALIVEKK